MQPERWNAEIARRKAVFFEKDVSCVHDLTRNESCLKKGHGMAAKKRCHRHAFVMNLLKSYLLPSDRGRRV